MLGPSGRPRVPAQTRGVPLQHRDEAVAELGSLAPSLSDKRPHLGVHTANALPDAEPLLTPKNEGSGCKRAACLAPGALLSAWTKAGMGRRRPGARQAGWVRSALGSPAELGPLWAPLSKLEGKLVCRTGQGESSLGARSWCLWPRS